MNHRKGCPEHHEAIAALAMGILPPGEAVALHNHLDSCEGCRAFYSALGQQERHLQSSFDQLTLSAQTAADDAAGCHGLAEDSQTGCHGPACHGEALLRSREDAAPRPRTKTMSADAACRVVPGQPQRFRRIVRAVAGYPRLAIAAVVLAGAIGLFTLSWHAGKDPLASPAQAAYSDVLQQIAKARSVRFTKSSLDDGETKPTVLRQTALEGGWMRTESGANFISIDNFVTGDDLFLNPVKKVARLRHMVQTDRQRLINYVDWIQTLHERDAVYTGRETLDGTPVDVYVVERPYEKATVWADVKTNLPVRVVRVLSPCTDKDIRVPCMELSTEEFMMLDDEPSEIRQETIHLESHGIGICETRSTTTVSDFAWNIDVDESLFSLTPPEGYTVERKTDYGDSIEKDQALVEALRFWAEMSAGRFPDNINMLSDARPLLVRKYRGTDRADEAYQQALRMMHVLITGMFFAQQLKLEDNWHYAGKTVHLGQADAPLAWWLDKKTGLWKVIYGDLHTADLPPDQKPADPAPQTRPAP